MNQLHAAFSTRRVNNVNLRREYFSATPDEVRLELAQRVGNLLEFTEIPEATQYNMSRSQWPDRQPTGPRFVMRDIAKDDCAPDPGESGPE